MHIEEVVGQRIQIAREAHGLSQEALGQELGTYLRKPWSRQAVSTAEKGGREFNIAELVALAHVLGVHVAWFIVPPEGLESVEMPSGRTIAAERIRKRIATEPGSPGAKADTAEVALRMLKQAREQLSALDGLVGNTEEYLKLISDRAPEPGKTKRGSKKGSLWTDEREAGK